MRVRAGAWAAVAVVVAAILSHLPALWNGFAFDDALLVSQHALVSQEAWGRVFTSPYHAGLLDTAGTGLYRPLTVLTLVADHALGGGAPLPFHLTNLLLHAGVALLVLGLGRRFGLPAPAPLLGALLFAVHPAPSEAVASVAGRADLLAAAFALGAVLCLRRPLAFAALLFASLLAKETALLLFLVPLAAPLGRTRLRAAASGAAAAALYLAMRAAVLGTLVPGSLRGTYVENPLGVLPALARVPAAAAVALRAVSLLLFPHHLSPDYGWAETGPVPGAVGAVAVTALLALGVAGIVLARRQPRAAPFLCVAAFSWFLVSNLAVPIGTAFGERLLYLPLAALAPLAGWVVVALPGRAPRRLGLAAAVVLLGAAGLRTWTASAAWHDDYTLARAAVVATPRSVKVLGNLAVELAQRGRTEEAKALLERALALAPDMVPLLLNRASLALQEGRLDDAARDLARILSAHPSEPMARLLFAQLAARRGDLALAESTLAGLVAERPGWQDPALYLERIRKARRGSASPADGPGG